MARDLVVRIRADASSLRTQLRTAQNSLTTFGKDVDKNSSKVGAMARTWGPVLGVAVAAGAGAMVKAAADFDEAMSSVGATGADAKRNIDDLRAAAIQAGADTKFSATEAAGGVEALAKAGVSAADILGGGLDGALALSAAGNLDVAGSAEAAASAMAQFSLSGQDVPHIADLLAAGAGKAQGEVSDMAAALNQAGLVASGAGASIEETTGTLAAFANAGLLGSDAGTSFKTMLQRLQNPAAEARAEMNRLGITAYDANGSFVGLEAIAGQLRDAFRGQTDEARAAALATIFGADAVRAANVLYNEGEGGIHKWTDAVDDSGFAADVAAEKMNNLKGDLEQLRGSLETVFIKGGGGAQGPLRTFIQELTELTNSAGDAGNAWDDLLKKLNLGGVGKTGGEETGLFSAAREFREARKASDQSGLSYETTIKFRTEGAPKAIADTARVASNAKATPKQVRTALRLQGWSTKGIEAVVQAMGKIDRKQVRANLRLQGFTTKEIDAVIASLDDVDQKDLKPKKLTLTADQAKSSIVDVLGGLGDIDAESPKPTVAVNDRASGPLGDIKSDIASLKDKTVTITTVYKTKGTPPGGFMGGRVASIPGFAGGRVPGSPPSNPTQDNVLARDERGRLLRVRSREFIINEPASEMNARLLAAINSGYNAQAALGFAGGRVSGGSSSAPAGEMKISGRVTVNGLDGYIEGVAVNVIGATDAHKRQAARRRG